jgi:hypothetical protein
MAELVSAIHGRNRQRRSWIADIRVPAGNDVKWDCNQLNAF